MRLLHLSDTHLHEPGAQTYHPEIDSASRLDIVLAACLAHGSVDAIALTGDVCDDGSTHGAEQVRERLAAAYPGVPALAVPGNHDLTESVRATFPALPTTWAGWRVVGSATNEVDRIEGLAAPVLEQLAAVDPDDPTPLLMLQHHPLRSRSTHEWFVLRDGERLAQRLAQQSGPVVLLTGHTHQAFQEIEGNVHHVGAPSTYYPIEHDGTDWQVAENGTGALLITLGDRAVESIEMILA